MITVIREEKPYRLITDGNGRYAVIEARCGHVYALQADQDHHRRCAPDTPEGMAAVAGEAWSDEACAIRSFRSMVENEERYSQIIW